MRASHEDARGFTLRLDADLLALLDARERVHAFGHSSGVTSISVSVPLAGHGRLHADRRAHSTWPTTLSDETSEQHYALRERPDEEGLITLDAKDLPEGFDEIAASERVELVLDNSGGHFTREVGSVAKRVSGPLLDRFDLRERMVRVPTGTGGRKAPGGRVTGTGLDRHAPCQEDARVPGRPVLPPAGVRRWMRNPVYGTGSSWSPGTNVPGSAAPRDGTTLGPTCPKVHGNGVDARNPHASLTRLGDGTFPPCPTTINDP